MKIQTLGLAFALVGTLSFAGQAKALSTFDVYLYQDGSDVVASGSGTIDLTDLFSDGSGNGAGFIFPFYGEIVLGPPGSPGNSPYSGITGPASFGPFVSPSDEGTDASSGSDGSVGVVGIGSILVVPSGYVSGSFLSGTSIYDDTTLSGLHVTPGTYTWTWGSGADAGSFTLYAGSAPVPEPSQYGPFAFLAVVGFIGWRRFKARAA